MESNWSSGRLYRFCDSIMKVAYMNLLWFCFSLVGLVIFGLLPATVALFAVVRKWLMNDEELSIFKTFFTTYKKEFFKANIIGIMFLCAGFILYFNYLYVLTHPGSLQLAISIPLVIVSFFYLTTCLYLIPVYVHYDLKGIQFIKHSFYIGMANPIMTGLMFLGCLLLSLLLQFIPGLLPFFFPSLFVIVIMWSGLRSFQKVEWKQKQYETT